MHMKSIANILKSLRVSNKDFKLSDFNTLVTENFKNQSIAAESLEMILKKYQNFKTNFMPKTTNPYL